MSSSNTAATSPPTQDALVSGSCGIRRVAAIPTCIHSSGHDPWRLIDCANPRCRCLCALTGSRHSKQLVARCRSLYCKSGVNASVVASRYNRRKMEATCCAGMKQSAIILRRYLKVPSSVVYAAWRPHSCICRHMACVKWKAEPFNSVGRQSGDTGQGRAWFVVWNEFGDHSANNLPS